MELELSLLLQTALLALLVSLPLLAIYIFRFHANHESKPFPFMKLPPELRAMVYEQLIDSDVSYPASKRPVKAVSTMDWLLHRRTVPATANLIMLANRQIHGEFSEVLCKKAKFVLSLDQRSLKNAELWEINPTTMVDLRKCEVRMITTSNMLGAADPRHMPREWPLCDRVCNALKICGKLTDLSLHIRAIGDPLWNPLWVWYHASQSFKAAEFSKFGSISFSLDSMSPGENHLARNDEGSWEWRCSAGHLVMPDSQRWQPIREFCHSLYSDCQECISESGAEQD